MLQRLRRLASLKSPTRIKKKKFQLILQRATLLALTWEMVADILTLPLQQEMEATTSWKWNGPRMGNGRNIWCPELTTLRSWRWLWKRYLIYQRSKKACPYFLQLTGTYKESNSRSWSKKRKRFCSRLILHLLRFHKILINSLSTLKTATSLTSPKLRPEESSKWTFMKSLRKKCQAKSTLLS